MHFSHRSPNQPVPLHTHICVPSAQVPLCWQVAVVNEQVPVALHMSFVVQNRPSLQGVFTDWFA